MFFLHQNKYDTCWRAPYYYKIYFHMLSSSIWHYIMLIVQKSTGCITHRCTSYIFKNVPINSKGTKYVENSVVAEPENQTTIIPCFIDQNSVKTDLYVHIIFILRSMFFIYVDFICIRISYYIYIYSFRVYSIKKFYSDCLRIGKTICMTIIRTKI